MDKRKKVLEIKLEANKQRLERKIYLDKLPKNLKEYLSEKSYIQTPEKEEIIEKGIFWIRPEGIGEPLCKPQSYKFQEFSWEEEILLATELISNKYDAVEAFFYPFMNNPIYCVEFGWAKNNLKDLFAFSEQEIGIVSTDLNVGIVISHYCGYLDLDPNPDEIVYELASWGF